MRPLAKILLILTLALGLLAGASLAWAEMSKEEAEIKIREAAVVLEKMMTRPGKGTPGWLLERAKAVAVFPNVVKGGFIVGGRFGRGVILARKKDGTWSGPAFFTIGGASVGLQIGAHSMDVLLVVMNPAGLRSLLKDKVTLGGDVAITAGPVGRHTAADTDSRIKATIYSYSMTKGLFAGVALQGAVLAFDEETVHKYYGRSLVAKEILLQQKIGPPPSAKPLIDVLKKYSK